MLDAGPKRSFDLLEGLPHPWIEEIELENLEGKKLDMSRRDSIMNSSMRHGNVDKNEVCLLINGGCLSIIFADEFLSSELN